MDNEMKLWIKGLEQLGVFFDIFFDFVFLMCVVVEMIVMDDIVCLDFFIDYFDVFFCCIQFDCFFCLICEKE